MPQQRPGLGTDVSVGATTQPDAANDPLLAALQQQADLLTGKMQRRRDELAVLAAVPPEQCAVNLASAIENLSIKVTGLQKAENDLKAQLDQATASAKANHDRLDAANIAEVQKEEKYREIGDAERDLQAANDTWSAKEAAYSNCITVENAPAVQFVKSTELRKTFLMAGSAITWFICGLLAIGELRRPKVITGIRPAAAPRINAPARVIPWPQPHQLQGLKAGGNAQNPMAEPEQALGI